MNNYELNIKMPEETMKKDYTLHLSILAAAVILASAWVYTKNKELTSLSRKSTSESSVQSITEKVLPSEGIILPVRFGNIGAELVKVGAIDAEKFTAIYEGRGVPMSGEYKILLSGKSDGNLKITKENAGYLLNLFWALGLANKNPILDSGEMTNKAYGGAGNFASTGGWIVAKGNPMDHYSKHKLINLTQEQQNLVEKISKGIYRPCCDNSTHFPDCNHGMAMLGFLEMMASQGVSEQDMWKAALTLNSFWFPDNYLTIATYMESNGIDWTSVSPKEMLGINYSSASGYKKIASKVSVPSQQGGSGCGVDASVPVVPKKQQSGCGV
ncbi:MAG: hypothetical protein HZA95_00120 [Candidatus Vogelbacteria bacterium]|nr:hypothetical protein [Candidatus Vogelbacteria bacterium]